MRKLSGPMTEALFFVARYGFLPVSVRANTAAALRSTFLVHSSDPDAGGVKQLNVTGWSALAETSLSTTRELIEDRHELALTMYATVLADRELFDPIPASEMQAAAPVLNAWRSAEHALIPDTYVRHVDESHEMALIMETQRAYLAGELDHEEEDIDALRPVFAPLVSDVDTAPMSVAQASLWVQDFSRDSGYGADYSDELAEMDRDAAEATLSNGDAQTWYGARDTVSRAANEYDRAVAHRSFGPWAGFHAARLGLLDAIESEQAQWRTSRFDKDMSSQLRCAALIARLAADPTATDVTVDGLRYHAWPETAPAAPNPSLQPYTAPHQGDSVYDAASGQHGTVHRVVSPDTVRVRWDGKHGRHLVAVSALTFVATAEALELWEGPAQTKSFLDSIRTQIRNSSTDDDAETFRPTGGCA